MNSKILLSSIVHKRFGKINHLFKYKVPSIFLDLDELEKVKKNSYIFSNNFQGSPNTKPQSVSI